MTVIRKAPNMTGHARVDVQPTAFDSLVYQKGMDVTWESAIKCPCKLDGRGHMSTCVNCGGCGWAFINPVKTKMVIQSLNLTTKNTQWSLEKIGMAAITCRNIDEVGDMDRITLDRSISKMSQVVMPRIYNSELFAFTNYPIVKIIDVFMFKRDDAGLVKLNPNEYSSSKNKVILNRDLYSEGMTITVRYTHRVQYFIVDMPREIRESNVLEVGKDNVGKLPISAIGRRCHYIINPDNFSGSVTVNNSYL